MELTALILGFMGSLHCVGMCSPLAMVATRKGKVFVNRFLYNGGRVLTYGVLGAVVSGMGEVLAFSRVQNLISVAVGIVLVGAGIFGTSGLRIPVVTPVLVQLTLWLKRQFASFLDRRGVLSVFVTGVFNGLLPCGLVYLALGYCLTLAGWRDGLFFMLLFGAGTLPAMLGLPALLSFLSVRLHFNLRHTVTVLFVLSGSLLIMRGVLYDVPQAGVAAHPSAIPVCR